MSLVGRKVMEYEIRALLGSGGMGEVYEAVDPLVGRVAVKTLHPHLAAKKDQVARFLGEAIGAAAVRNSKGGRNENIINVIGRGEIDGRQVLVLEFLEGCDLETWLYRRQYGGHGPLALDDVCRIILQLCYALDGVHRAGIVHRDLKPPNVFVLDNGPRRLFLKVLDFGIAKLRADQRMTGVVTSAPMGTLQYMAPEQANTPQLVDTRADVWALGCILYRVLTGRDAFTVGEEDAWGVVLRARQVAGELPPAPSSLRRDVDARWDAIIARCLQADPSNRYPHVQMLAEEIINAAGDDGLAVFAEVWPGGFVSDPDAHTVRNAAAAAIVASGARSTPPPAPSAPGTLGSMGGAAGMIEPRPSQRTPRWAWAVTVAAFGAVALAVVLATRSPDPEPAATGAPPAASGGGAGAASTAPVSAVDAGVLIDAAAVEGVDVEAGAAAADVTSPDAGVSPRRRVERRKGSPHSMPIDAGVRAPAPAPAPPDAGPARRRFNPDGVIRPE